MDPDPCGRAGSGPASWRLAVLLQDRRIYVPARGDRARLRSARRRHHRPDNHGRRTAPGELVAGKPRLVPPGIGEWSTTIAPLHFQGETLPPVGGVVGVAAVVFYPDTIESDALAAGHDAFNSALEFKLNTLLPTLKPMATNIERDPALADPDQIKALADGVGHVVHDAIYDAMDVWDKAHRLVTGGGQWFESVFTMVSQDHFGSDPFAQLDLGGTFTFLLGAAGHLGGLSAAVTRSRPTAAQTVRVHIPQPVTAVAGFTVHTSSMWPWPPTAAPSPSCGGRTTVRSARTSLAT